MGAPPRQDGEATPPNSDDLTVQYSDNTNTGQLAVSIDDGSTTLATLTFNPDGTFTTSVQSPTPGIMGLTSYFNTAEQLTETITSEPTVTVIDQFDLLTGWVSYEAQYQANGPLVQIFYDPENTQSWSSIQRAWTNANATNAVSQTTTYDDGRRQVLSWDQKANSIQTETDYNTDGSYKVTWWDTENSNSWSSWWATYDSSGRLAQDMA